jgi:hypothetical protein
VAAVQLRANLPALPVKVAGFIAPGLDFAEPIPDRAIECQ